jgi:Fe(3+) dicitrate transport protein
MLDAAGSLDDDEITTIPGLVLLDLAASVVLTRDLSLYATVTNLLDENNVVSWRPAGARPTPPRQFYVGVKGTLGKASIEP